VRIGRVLQDFRRDAAITWGYGGPRQLWDAFLWRVVYRVYRREGAVLFEQDLTAAIEQSTPAAVQIRPLADRDWGPIAGALTSRAFERFHRNALGGSVCLVAWRGEQPVGHTWLSEPGTAPASLPIPLPSDATYGWDLWVDPRERSRGTGSALVRARLRYARERGYRRTWRIVTDHNRPALRTLEKSSGGGLRVLGRVTYATFLGRNRARYQPS
jgi:ribosomal protein S18 acetylase RimI-like enzyme